MGLRASKSGVVVQFFDKKNKPKGSPIYGTYVALSGRPRDEVATPSSPLKGDESKYPGSDDWLTRVAVADTKQHLDEIVKAWPQPSPIPSTSASSRRVLVEVHVGEIKKSAAGRITIADGKVLSEKPPRMEVVLLKVLASGAKLSKKHPMFEEFQSRVPFPPLL
jgi:hypothetical protein